MKMIELRVTAVDADGHYAYYSGNNGVSAMLFGNLEITKSGPLILMSKKDFEELLANQKGQPIEDLPFDTKVMICDADMACWMLALYKRKGMAYPVSCQKITTETRIFKYDHIIPFNLFDPENPDKWNGTENDYGLKGKGINS